MFQSLLNRNNIFYEKYMRSFAARSSVSSVHLESGTELGDYKNALAITAHLDAYDYLLDHFLNNDIQVYDLPDIIKLITNGEYENFRKIPIVVSGSAIPRTQPFLITSELFALFKDYKCLETEIENPYLLESIFHIRFLKIHPFEDGNGRCARLLTCFHLLKKNLSPVCIPKELKSLYCQFIENNDYDNLANMFEKLSKTENVVMNNIWEKYQTQKNTL